MKCKTAQAKRMSKAWWDQNATIAQNSERHLYWGAHYSHIAELEKFVSNRRGTIDYTFVRPSQLDESNIISEAYIAEADTFFISGKPLPRPALACFIVNDCVLANKYVGDGVAIAGPED